MYNAVSEHVRQALTFLHRVLRPAGGFEGPYYLYSEVFDGNTCIYIITSDLEGILSKDAFEPFQETNPNPNLTA